MSRRAWPNSSSTKVTRGCHGPTTWPRSSGNAPIGPPISTERAEASLALASRAIGVLFANGQTTEQVVHAAGRVGERLGVTMTVAPGWGATILTATCEGGTASTLVTAIPSAVDMRKVVAGMHAVDALCDGRADVAATEAALAAAAGLQPISVRRFASMAAAGAAALAVVFGVTRPAELALIALSAGCGGVLRRWTGRMTGNLFAQPLAASLLAGAIGAMAIGRGPGAISALVALCPCMVLVPGPHLLNGAIDVLRGRIPLGVARLVYAGTTILMICAGLLLGLAFGGQALPVGSLSARVPFVLDVLAAGVAVLAYGTFFSLPWRSMPVPVLVGMTAHGLRWILIWAAHASPAAGAFWACVLVGVVMAPLSDRRRVPFAGYAFASVVSLIPGVFLFRMASQLVETLGGNAGLVADAATSGMTALLIMLAMVAGLVIPRFLIHAGPGGARPRRA